MKSQEEHGMHKSRGFTLIELLVVIAIIALLMSILMPALSRVKNQARTVACRANLKQWNLYFSMYAEDNNGRLEPGVGNGHTFHWFNALRKYYKNDHKFCCCPTALKPLYDESGNLGQQFNVFSAWGIFKNDPGFAPEGDWGSYGVNGWVEDPPAGTATVYEGFDTTNNWRTPNVKEAAYAPLLMDSLRFNLWPLHTDNPPVAVDEAWESTQHMRRICIDRHSGGINMAFLDWSVRKVGIKELWTLRWHKTYNTEGPWTRAGGVLPSNWPQWMQPLKDY
jgi:prepilin-type N-terminal cleavage/methylation domain-containing protein/prepilin-type processing-associated H-X9-DG protein